VGVVGLGLIGGSIARRLIELPERWEALALTRTKGTAVEAADAGIQIAGSVEELAKQAELVVVATPPKNTASVIAAVLAADQDVLVTDVASVKAPIASAVMAEDRYLPSHPLAGAETSGWAAARADLLDGTTWAVCPASPTAPPDLLCRFGELFDAFDGRLIVCDPREHDLAVAQTSHAPHVVAAALAAAIRRHDSPGLAAALSGGAFRDITRVARADPAMWQEIFELNEANVAAALADLRETLDGEPPWESGREAAELADRLRWQTPEWERREFDWPAWDELRELGRAGTAIRRPAADGDGFAAEVNIT
jgi:prephenate dehydrogenase